MVYGDLNTPISKDSRTQIYYASPFARGFSALLDYFIFFPLVTFFMTIFFKDSMGIISSTILSGKLNSILIQLFAFYILFFTFIQAVFIYFYRATPGQSYLKIFFVFEEKQSNLFFQIWLRQIGFVVSLLALGIPFLAVFYHIKHRPFYDRLSECDIMTTKDETHSLLPETDQRYISASVSAIICFFSVTFLISIIQSHNLSVKQLQLAVKPKALNPECFVLNEQSAEDRLRAALALNILNRLPGECVALEADSILDDPESDLASLAYFAKYHVEENSEDKKKYLSLACLQEGPSDLCQKQRNTATISSPEPLWEKLIKPQKELK